MAALSPSSSPRLPSPPPMAEDQIGPNSPLTSSEEESNRLNHGHDNGAARRIRPGTKAEDMAEGPPLVDLQDIDSAFQLTEHLKSLHHALTHPAAGSSLATPQQHATSIPLTRPTASQLAHAPPGTDRALWLYELCRFLVQRANTIVVALFADSPACSSLTCPEMRASEWQYLCAVHDPPKSCCAIDYCCHTLDWAAGVLTSPKVFPSRLSLGGSGAGGGGGGGGGNMGGGKEGLGREEQQQQQQGNATHQVRQLTNIFRRVYRIFAHAWFQHREVFWNVESRTGLYVFFKTVCDVYSLIPEDNYTVPPEAEGTETTPTDGNRRGEDVDGEFRRLEKQKTLTVLGRERPEGMARAGEEEGKEASEEVGVSQAVGAGNTTKRHRQSTVDQRSSVSTVIEEKEEDEEEEEEEHQHEGVHEETVPEKQDVAPDPLPTAIRQSDAENEVPELKIDEPERSTELDGENDAKTDEETAHGDVTVIDTKDEAVSEEKDEPPAGGETEESASSNAVISGQSDNEKPEEASSEDA
ncbi:MAG: hypothetical protein M1821_007842 [Bathelium mastoideum]|nr:MAG: hypothetical protein M1821_007842 [Bathelium mastoideum]